jgi:hypothetical protein
MRSPPKAGAPLRCRLQVPARRADSERVKRIAVAIVALIALAVLTAVSYASGVIPGTDGCVVRSVDKKSYVAKNEAVFSAVHLPDYLRQATTNTYSVGIPAMHSCPPNENGPPYEAYVTWHVFIQPLGHYPRGYDHRLLGPEWVSQNGGLSGDESFRRGQASLYISTSDEATSFSVDHRRYDR